jgi:hypothetical protein
MMALLETQPVVQGDRLLFGSLNGSQYFAVRRDGDRFVTRGLPDVFVGHQIPPPGGGRPDGAYVEWHWDGSRLTVRNDPYGLLPAYYCLSDGGFAISTSIKRLIEEGAPAELDEDALAVFLRLGTFLGDDTPFRAIRALPPGTHYAWAGQQHAPQGRVLLGVAATGLTRDAACRRYGELFRRSVQRRAVSTGSEAVALSGGMDSRHILLELCRAGRKPRFAVTARVFRGGPSHDVDLARAVCQQAGVEHVVVDQSDDWLDREQRKNEATNFSTFEHAWGLPVAGYLTGRAEVVFDGLGGDVFTDCRGITTPSRLEAFRSGRFTELADDFLGPPSGRLSYLRPELRLRLSRERAVARFAAECARFAAAPNPPAAFWFWNRTRRAVGLLPYGVWQRSVQVLTPYLDEDLFDFMIGLPAELVGDYRFHAETIRREYPQHAHIPFYSLASAPPGRAWEGLRRIARTTLVSVLTRGSSINLSRGYAVSRLARALVDRDYCRSIGWLPLTLVYLMQLEQLAAGSPKAWRRSPAGITKLIGAEIFGAALRLADVEIFLV